METRRGLGRDRRAWSAVAAAAVGLLVASGCGITGPNADLRLEIVRNRALWEAVRPVSYVYTVARSCFCPPEWIGPVRVEVEGGAVTSRTYTSSEEPVDTAMADAFPDVDGLFEVLIEAVEADAATVTVEWDEDSGVPLDFFIDYDERVADEELGFQVLVLPAATGS